MKRTDHHEYRPKNRSRLQLWLSIIISILVLAIGILAALAQRKDDQVLHTAEAVEVLPTPSPSHSASVNPSPSPSSTPSAISTSQGSKIPILMYHYIRQNAAPSDTLGAGLSVNPKVFAQQLATLKAAGYQTVTFKDVESRKPLPAKPIILTFDDGYDDAYSAALPALQKEGMTGVFYIVSGFMNKSNYITTDQVKALDAAGMEIGAHSINHMNLAGMGESEQSKQLTESKQVLETLVGKSVTSFCYPAGKYNETTITLAKKIGYTSATTTQGGVAIIQDFTTKPYELNRIRVKEGTDLLKVIGDQP